MRYNAKSLEINVVISGNVLLFKDIKISLGLLITAREMHALFRGKSLPRGVNNCKTQANLSALHPIK